STTGVLGADAGLVTDQSRSRGDDVTSRSWLDDGVRRHAPPTPHPSPRTRSTRTSAVTTADGGSGHEHDAGRGAANNRALTLRRVAQTQATCGAVPTTTVLRCPNGMPPVQN